MSHIAKTFGSTSIRHRPDTFVSDRCLIDVDPSVFVVWDAAYIFCTIDSTIDSCYTRLYTRLYTHTAICIHYHISWYPPSAEVKRGSEFELTVVHYNAAIMSAIYHQPHDCLLNRLFKAQIKKNIKAPRYWPLGGEFTGHRTKGQQRGKCLHLVTSSCVAWAPVAMALVVLDKRVLALPIIENAIKRK